MQQQSRRNLYLIKVAYLRGVDQLDCLANRKESWKIVVIVEEEEGGGGGVGKEQIPLPGPYGPRVPMMADANLPDARLSWGVETLLQSSLHPPKP